FKPVLPRRVGGEGVTTNELSFGVKTQELGSHVVHRALRFGLRLLPTETAESIELRFMTFGARITLHQIEPLDRHVQLRFVGVKEQHELAGTRAEIESLQTAETRDAMIDVNDIVVGFQVAKVREES